MAVVPGDPNKPQIWNDYRTIIRRHDVKFKEFEFIEGFVFYKRVRNAYAVLATKEFALHASFILEKGVITA